MTTWWKSTTSYHKFGKCIVNMIENVEDFDLHMLTLTLQLIQLELDALTLNAKEALGALLQEQHRRSREPEKKKERPSWSSLFNSTSNRVFRRMFRMKKKSFIKLCDKICAKVGEDKFLPEEHIKNQENWQKTNAATDHKGGLTPGEMKVAIALRMLAGASYLDLLWSFKVSDFSAHKSFHVFISWALLTFDFVLVPALKNKDWTLLKHISAQYSLASSGMFLGVIGAIDGLCVRMRCPFLSKADDPGNYFSRKGFFALNVQAICDSKKRFLWASPWHQGSSHDSSAFNETGLSSLLDELTAELEKLGLFLVGDSAHNMKPTLLTPFLDALSQSDEDAFNFWLSNSRITIECAFGELIMRWGLFWRTLKFSLYSAGDIIKAAMLLHNFLVDEREDESDPEDVEYFRDFSFADLSEDEVPSLLRRPTNEVPDALVTDNNEPRPRGRPSCGDAVLKARAEKLRENLLLSLSLNGKVRPQRKGTKYNKYGHVYMDY